MIDKLTSLGYRTGANLLPVPYDWRLSNRYSGCRLAGIVEPALQRWRDQSSANTSANAQLVFICHSMGGLVARWYIEKCGGAELTRKLITFGTPYRGAAKTVDQLVNGEPPQPGAAVRGPDHIRPQPAIAISAGARVRLHRTQW